MDTLTELSELTQSLSGIAICQADEAYAASKAAWNLTIDHTPSVIVEVANVADLQAAVRFAAKHKLPVTVQTTGHGQPRPCQGGLLIQMGRLNSVKVNAASGTAIVGGGAVWGDVIGAAHPHGLAPISGSSPGVGVVGYLVGGGYGLMSRKYGLSVDHLRSATMVLADGSIVRASAEENPDLFWAIRGGGGAFGVIAELEIGLVPHPEVYGGNVMYDAEHAHSVLKAWSEWTKTAPDEISSALVLMTFPPVPFVPEFLHGRSVVIFLACAACSAGEAEAALAPMRTMDGAEFDSFRWMPYTESASIFNDPTDPLPAMGNGRLLREFDNEAIEAFLAGIGSVPESPNLMIQVRHLGGAISRVNHEQTPIGDRRCANYLAYFLGIPMPHNPPDRIAAHADAALQKMAPWTQATGPLNWVGEANVAACTVRGVYDEGTFGRLVEAKRRYDPANTFSTASIGIWAAENA